MWVPSIRVVTTESTSHPAVVFRVASEHGLTLECNSSIWDVIVEPGLCEDVGPTVFGLMFVLPVQFCPSRFPVTGHYLGADLKASWISMALTLTVFLHKAVGRVRLDWWKTTPAVMVSKSITAFSCRWQYFCCRRYKWQLTKTIQFNSKSFICCNWRCMEKLYTDTNKSAH